MVDQLHNDTTSMNCRCDQSQKAQGTSIETHREAVWMQDRGSDWRRIDLAAGTTTEAIDPVLRGPMSSRWSDQDLANLRRL